VGYRVFANLQKVVGTGEAKMKNDELSPFTRRGNQRREMSYAYEEFHETAPNATFIT
jgi:hypothetical protein